MEDYPEQYALAQKIQAEVGQLLKWSEESAALVTAKSGPKRLKARVRIPTGQQRLKTLQADLSQFFGEEKRLNDERAEALEGTGQHFQILLVAGGLATFLLTGLLTVLFNRNITGRISALAANIGRVVEPTAGPLSARKRRDCRPGRHLSRHGHGPDRVGAGRTALPGIPGAARCRAHRGIDRNQLPVAGEEHRERTVRVHRVPRSAVAAGGIRRVSRELPEPGQDLRLLLADETLPPAIRQRGRELLDQGVTESVQFIQSGVKRLSSIIDALVRLSRAGRVEYQYQPVEISDVVGRILEAMAGTIAQCAAAVTLHPLPPAWGIRLLWNRSSPICWVTPELPGPQPARAVGGGLVVRWGAGGGEDGFIPWRDNGLGIPAAYQAKVFQLFHARSPGGGPRRGHGTVVIVRRIVERHRGEVWVESREGQGSTFYLCYRRGPVNGEGSRPAMATAGHGVPGEGRLGS